MKWTNRLKPAETYTHTHTHTHTGKSLNGQKQIGTICFSKIFRIFIAPIFAIFCGLFCHIESAHAVKVSGVTYHFSMTTKSLKSGAGYSFSLSPKGTFYVDCGTGGTLDSYNSTAKSMISGGTINKTNTTEYDFECLYSSAGVKTIAFGGSATDYNTSTSVPAIRAGGKVGTYAKYITQISGDLSPIFPIYDGATAGKYPVFYNSFNSNTLLTSIPETLFAGYTSGGSFMFNSTFYGCTGLTSIPENLFNFSGYSIPGAQSMFNGTFLGCTGLTSIPENLFSKITSGASTMFFTTFSGCTNIAGYIPPSTFRGLIINGHPTATNMWFNAFKNTQLVTTCPTGTSQYITGYEGTNANTTWNGKVSCITPLNVTYACGVGGGTAPSGTTATYNASFTPASNTCTVPTGYSGFAGWLVSGTSDVKPAGTVFTWNYPEDKTLTAQYETAKFTVNTSSIAANGTFQFSLSAQGTFYVNCGTGGTLSSDNSTANAMISGGTINKTDTTQYTFKCTYSSAGTKTVQFGGTATNYDTSATTAPISFYTSAANAALITSISGNLSTIFPYISGNAADGAQPRFYRTFRGAKNITSIPDTLFSGYTVASTYMFGDTFYGCTDLTSIPENLFFPNATSVSGASNMFAGTFNGCTGLTSIPENLFSKITSGASRLFYCTFYVCTGLTSIPANLFFPNATSVSGADSMFYNTFQGCTGLTSIPANLFSKITSGASELFRNTFNACKGLTSIPENLFFPNATSVSGASNMFANTFKSCKGLTSIPENLFSKITSGATDMFKSTFQYCSNLTGYIPPTFFDGLIKNNAATDTFNSTFGDTGMLTSCPSGTTQYASTYTSGWGGKVSCTPNTISLTWDGVSSSPSSCTYGGTFIPPTPAARTGYIFSGWKVKTVTP